MLRALVRVGLIIALPAVAGGCLAGRAHVLDGDTLAVGGIHVWPKGAAAPEVAHHDQPGEPGGEAAKAFMVDLVEGQVVLPGRTGHCRPADRGGLPRDCPRLSGGRYASVDRPAAKALPLPGHSVPR